MGNLILYITIFFTVISASATNAQNEIPIDIRQAIVIGNSKQLATFFNQNVELLIRTKEDVYSKAQAELILKDFFSKNEPDKFIVEIEGESNGINYAIGNLITTSGKFRVYLAYQKVNGKSLINRLNISEYN